MEENSTITDIYNLINGTLNATEQLNTPRRTSGKFSGEIIATGISGILAIVFNCIMLVLYWRHNRMRRHISSYMLQLYLFCLIHGVLMMLVYIPYNMFFFRLPPAVCVVGYIVTELFNHYTLALLVMLVTERFISIKYPFCSESTSRKWTSIATVSSMAFTVAVTVIPLIPHVGAPEINIYSLPDARAQRRIEQLYEALSCNGYLNRHNLVTPLIGSTLSVLSVLAVIILYCTMYHIAKRQSVKFKALTQSKRKKLTRAAISVLLVTIVFSLTIVPFGLISGYLAVCQNQGDISTGCMKIGVRLSFIFKILAYLSNFLAPLLFSLFSPAVRREIVALFCSRCGVNTVVTSTNTPLELNTASK